MGANDDREMLEVAKEECGRLEREVAELKRYEALANKHWHRDQDDLALVVAERDKALAERDASRQVNAEFLAARSEDVLVEGSFFRADEFPAILGNYMRLSVANSSAMKAGYLHTERIRGQRDAAEAAIAAVQAVVDDEAIPDEFHGDNWVMVEDLAPILAKSPADALAEVRATAWDEGAEAHEGRALSTPSGMPIDPPLNPYRTQSLADAHTADLQRQNAVYAASPMNGDDGGDE